MGKVLAILLVKAAQGDFGSFVAAAYWKTAGYKTWFGIVLAAVAAGLNEAAKAGMCAGCGSWGARVAAIAAAVTIILGQVDGGVRTEAPRKGDFVTPPASKS